MDEYVPGDPELHSSRRESMAGCLPIFVAAIHWPIAFSN